MNDALWDPNQEPDAELKRLQDLLRRFSAAHRGLTNPGSAIAKPKTVRRRRRGLALMTAAALLLVVAFQFRLAWTDGRPWSVSDSAGATYSLALGDRLEALELPLRISVARIGSIELSPGSTLKLVETGHRRHRVHLENGHLRAKIWAPPGRFGITDGDSEAIDIGCEFEFWRSPDGRGRLQVASGWVMYRIGERDVLVPEGHWIEFDPTRFTTPMRNQVAPLFAAAVAALERGLSDPDASDVASLSASLAATAEDADAYTLLAILSAHPTLADTELYDRLASAFATAIDEQHRQAWRRGEREAIDAWWQFLPKQPKHWWLHWRDVF